MNHIHSCYLKSVSPCPATLGSSPQDSLFLLHVPLPSQLPTEWVPSLSNVVCQMYLGLRVLPWLLHPEELIATGPNHPHSPQPPTHCPSSASCDCIALVMTSHTRVVYISLIFFSSVQFSCSVVSDSLWSHGLQHSRPAYPSPTPRAYSNSCPLSRWCHPTISSSVVPFSSALSLSQHQGLFQWVGSFQQVARVLAFQLQWIFQWILDYSNEYYSNEYSGLISFRMDWLDLTSLALLKCSMRSGLWSNLFTALMPSSGKECLAHRLLSGITW